MRSCLGNLFKLGARVHLSFNYAQKRLLQNRALDGGVRNIFDRKVKQMQKQRAVLSPDGHIFEYLKEEVAAILSSMFNNSDVLMMLQLIVSYNKIWFCSTVHSICRWPVQWLIGLQT